MKKTLLTICIATMIAGCAKPPSRIAATAVSSAEYSDLTCREMVGELADVSEKLDDASRRQRNKVATDAATVFLVLVPVTAMSGDNEAEVAKYKGEKDALQRAMSKRDC